jgi:hypothetical protein
MNEIKIPHPDFGYVIFTEPTPRQKEILLDYLSYITKFQDKKLENKDVV